MALDLRFNLRAMDTYRSGAAQLFFSEKYSSKAITAKTKYTFFDKGLSDTVTTADTNLQDDGKIPAGTFFSFNKIGFRFVRPTGAAATPTAWLHDLMQFAMSTQISIQLQNYADVGSFSLASWLAPVTTDIAVSTAAIGGTVAPLWKDLGDLGISLSEQVKFGIQLDSSNSTTAAWAAGELRIQCILQGEELRQM